MFRVDNEAKKKRVMVGEKAIIQNK